MATIYRVDGTTEQVEPENKKKGFTLKELYKHTNSEIVEIVYLEADKIMSVAEQDLIMVVDEEGLFNSKAFNRTAGRMAKSHIVGDVLVCKNSEVK